MYNNIYIYSKHFQFKELFHNNIYINNILWKKKKKKLIIKYLKYLYIYNKHFQFE